MTTLRWGVLQDSGGFQMVSLVSLSEVTEEGVRFRSPYDGDETLLSPERSVEIQNALGSDIIMQLDDVVSSTVTGPRVEEAMYRCVCMCVLEGPWVLQPCLSTPFQAPRARDQSPLTGQSAGWTGALQPIGIRTSRTCSPSSRVGWMRICGPPALKVEPHAGRIRACPLLRLSHRPGIQCCSCSGS